MDPTEFTQLLRRGAEGDAAAENGLVPVVYDELRRLAGSFMRGQGPEHTLQATALVHEAWMKLAGADAESWESRRHFLGVAARAMRNILVDHARARKAAKRGGPSRERVPLDDVVDRAETSVRDVVAFDETLEELAASEPDLARLVELRFYVGLSMAEVADALGVSKPTAERRWAVARALLWERLEGRDVDTDGRSPRA